MRDIMLEALLPYSISDEAAYKLVHFLGDLTRTLDSIYHVQIQRHHQTVEAEFYCSMADVIQEEPPF